MESKCKDFIYHGIIKEGDLVIMDSKRSPALAMLSRRSRGAPNFYGVRFLNEGLQDVFHRKTLRRLFLITMDLKDSARLGVPL